MPLYEYHCEKCGNNFEVIQKFADAPLTIHEECGGTVERLLSAPAFQFKGSGWYVTDYAKGSSSHSDSRKSESNGESKSGDSKSADSKGGEKSGEKGGDKSESKGSSETKTESKPASSSGSKPD